MPGNDKTFGSPDRLSETAIIIDPVVPMAARSVLQRKYFVAQRHPGTTSRRGALIPYREIAPEAPPPPKPPWVTSPQAKRTWAAAVAIVVLFGGTLVAAAADSVIGMIVMLVLTGTATVYGVRSGWGAREVGWTSPVLDPQTILASDYDRWYERQGTAYYHRQYVVPATDIDSEHRPDWARAVAAVIEIRESYVVKSRLVDFEQVTAALPQRLWEIAEGFARLAEVRARQEDSARRAKAGERGADDPYFAAKIAGQSQKVEVARQRILSRIRELEDFAAVVRRADEAKQRELAVEQLGEVDDLLLDLLASTEKRPSDEVQAQQLRTEAEAVIAQAVEAAREFALPEADESEPESGALVPENALEPDDGLEPEDGNAPEDGNVPDDDGDASANPVGE
jgi:hypothetical protein